MKFQCWRRNNATQYSGASLIRVIRNVVAQTSESNTQNIFLTFLKHFWDIFWHIIEVTATMIRVTWITSLAAESARSNVNQGIKWPPQGVKFKEKLNQPLLSFFIIKVARHYCSRLDISSSIQWKIKIEISSSSNFKSQSVITGNDT